MKSRLTKSLSILLILVLCMSLFVACDKGGEGDVDDGITKVCLLINGNLGDKSFFDSANEGIKMVNAKDATIVTTVKEVGQDASKWESSLREVCESKDNFDLIIVGTEQMREKLQRISLMFPNKKFIIFDSDINKDAKGKKFANVYSIQYRQNEGSFLAGVLVASWLQQLQSSAIAPLKAGFVGGLKADIIKDFAVGYYQGLQYVNSLDAMKTTKTYSTYVGGFTDSATGKEHAKTQYNQGADILFQAASQSGLGCIDAASEFFKVEKKNKYIIGVDSDQHKYFSTGDTADLDKASRIVTSVLKRVDLSIFQAIMSFKSGELVFGKTVSMGLDTVIEGERVISLAKNDYYMTIVPENVRLLIDKAEEAIIAKTIAVKSAYTLTLSEYNEIEDSVKL